MPKSSWLEMLFSWIKKKKSHKKCCRPISSNPVIIYPHLQCSNPAMTFSSSSVEHKRRQHYSLSQHCCYSESAIKVTEAVSHDNILPFVFHLRNKFIQLWIIMSVTTCVVAHLIIQGRTIHGNNVSSTCRTFDADSSTEDC